MTQNEEELQAIYRHACELQNKIYGSHICNIQITCSACKYGKICELTALLIRLIEHDIYSCNTKGELKDDNN